jgi:Flp pilus assembly protein TadD
MALVSPILFAILATIGLKAHRGISHRGSMSETNRKMELLKLAESVMREERWSEAIRLLKENSAVIEKHWELLWNVGWCYFKLERMDQARKYLTRATLLAPENHVCKYGLGQVI